jgi:hypothetical protein
MLHATPTKAFASWVALGLKVGKRLVQLDLHVRQTEHIVFNQWCAEEAAVLIPQQKKGLVCRGGSCVVTSTKGFIGCTDRSCKCV